MQLGVDQVQLAQIGLAAVPSDPDRCFTVTPWWASPATPSPANTVMLPWLGVDIVCVGLALTASTIPVTSRRYRSEQALLSVRPRTVDTCG